MPQARRKGKSGELEVVHILRDAGWPDARRTHDGFSQADRGDIAGGPADISWECKRVERLELWPALEQAASDAGPKVPVLAFRRSRSRWYAALPLDELLALLRLSEHRENFESMLAAQEVPLVESPADGDRLLLAAEPRPTHRALPSPLPLDD